jgi:subtilase family serine protease
MIRYSRLAAACAALILAAAPPCARATTNAGDVVLGRAPASGRVTLIVHLPLRDEAAVARLVDNQSDPASPLYGHFLTPAQFRAAYGPDAATVRRASAALQAAGLHVDRRSTQDLFVSGPAAAAERAFGAPLYRVRDRDGHERVESIGATRMPAALEQIGAAVHGIAATADARPFLRPALGGGVPDNRQTKLGPYWFDDLKQAYHYPSYTVANGSGATIATVGVSAYSASDATLFYGNELLGPKPSDLGPAPKIELLAFAGSDAFNPAKGASDEANLDVQQAGGSAPGATVIGVAVPDLPTLGGFLLGYDYIDENSLADVVSTSFGGCELLYTKAYNGGQDFTGLLRSFHDLFLQGNSEGITFVFSSGDEAGLACPELAYFENPNKHLNYKYVPSVNFWSNDPNVTAVGGTNLETTFVKGSLESKYLAQNEDGDPLQPSDPYGVGNNLINGVFGSGGGASTIWPAFAAQKALTGGKQREVPDVAMQMGGCPTGAKSPCGPNRSSVVAAVGGKFLAFVGTSASAPDFAGLVAVRVAIGKKRLGNVNTFIYAASKSNGTGHYFIQGIAGNNGVITWPAKKAGYNMITGNGTPLANDYVLLPHAVLAGNPQTSTNP